MNLPKAVKVVCFTKFEADKVEKKYTFSQGAIMPTWWKVPPVMMTGESELPNLRITTAERKKQF